jgi:hypothetical protein
VNHLAVAPQFEGLPTSEAVPRPALYAVPDLPGQPGEPIAAPDVPRPNLYLVEEPVAPPAESAASLIDADSVPELRLARQKAATEAAAIMGRNRELMYGGQAENVPRPVDAMGTVRQVVAAKREFGEDSPQFKERFQGLMKDTERLLGEAYTINTKEYFAPIQQKRDPITGEYSAHDLQIKPMMANGLSPFLANTEEGSRRVNDFVQHGTHEAIGDAIGRVGLHDLIQQVVEVVPGAASEEQTLEHPVLSVLSISECTDEAIDGYKVNPKGAHGGYGPATERMMIGGVSFTASGDLYEERVALSGLYIDHDVIIDVLVDEGVLAEGERPTKTEIHAMQLLSVTGLSAMDLVKKLDRKASEKSGKRIFIGEAVSDDHPMDYEAFVEEAEIRRQNLAPKPREIAEYLVSLEEKGVDSAAAEGLLDACLKQTLLEVASKNPDLAEAMFDTATAEGFKEVARLKAEGRDTEANWLQAAVEKNAPEVSYCGAGGCGLEAATLAEAAKARELGLEGSIIHDKERSCPSCNAMKVHYDLSGNKACTGCSYSTVGPKPAADPKK